MTSASARLTLAVLAWRPRTYDAGSPRPLGRQQVAGYAAVPGLGSAGPASSVTVATVGNSGRQLDIADVIAAGPACGAGAGALLRRYPGCAVAAVSPAPGQCRLTVRSGRQATLIVHGACGWPPVRSAVLCGVFAHAWLTAGLPLPALDGAVVELAPSVPAAWWRGLAQDGVVSVSLTAGESAACRCLIWAASGAPSLV